jgi:hypothetical protein
VLEPEVHPRLQSRQAVSVRYEQAFIVHWEFSGPGHPWEICCARCHRIYWTSEENARVAAFAGLTTLCVRCMYQRAASGEMVTLVGGVKDGKMWPYD